ncbi:glutathione S-transferase [Sediminicoccus sp. KRV36]|uniref:glutathione S-transferase family protein n=1 Tax=Sediminicoccus sp. KRV36 TaxID=3133721 RepID=UPI00200F2F96|nr:glutathione S-transferase [Sediminicoccus rosea]UPY37105.1 glutathione S-transferase C-terminal domain-containing protein [Sediminicoccus rosea]
MAAFRLHCFPESGGCYKAALMLALCGAAWEGIPVDYYHGETRTPEWRARVSVMGEVPVVEHAGRSHTQSGAILTWLSQHFGRFAAEDREEELRWLLFDNHKFTSYLATWRWLVSFTPNPDAAVIAFFRARMENAFRVVEAQLAGRDFLLGNSPCIADISMQGYLHFPQEEWPLDLTPFPNIRAWIARFRAMPGWKPPYELLPGARFPKP